MKTGPAKKSKFFVEQDMSPDPESLQEDIKINSTQYQQSDESLENTSEKKEEKNSVLYCVCGKLCEGNNTTCSSCLSCQKPVEFSGYLLTSIDEKIQKCWILLLNKELYSTKGIYY